MSIPRIIIGSSWTLNPVLVFSYLMSWFMPFAIYLMCPWYCSSYVAIMSDAVAYAPGRIRFCQHPHLAACFVLPTWQHVLWWFVSMVQSVGHRWQMWTPDVCASVMEALDGKESWWRRLAYQIFFKSRHMFSVPFFPFCYLLCTGY